MSRQVTLCEGCEVWLTWVGVVCGVWLTWVGIVCEVWLAWVGVSVWSVACVGGGVCVWSVACVGGCVGCGLRG